MLYRAVVLFALITMAGATLACTSCDKLKKNIKGTIAGQIQTPSGTGIGYYSVALYNVEAGVEIDRQNASDSGTFLFREVTAGVYIVKLFDLTGTEVPADCPEIKLGTGRTKTITVTLHQ